MELFLNFAWACLALTSVCLWSRFDRREKSERRLPFIALAMLIVMLFPVISVSDDLWALQNPAEADSSIRRDHSVTVAHAFFPAVAMPEAAFAGLTSIHERSSEPLFHASLPVGRPAVDRIQNRPPPAA
jgi:hypothetical protein